MTPAYYNENDPTAAAWLRELIKAGLIAAGDVDERSICDVQASDLSSYGQCHFFAGIGGWSLALRLAGVSDDSPIWTGSCPCQSFSCAGTGKGKKDKRHLWPEMYRIARVCRPAKIVGEQVENAIGHEWLDGVFIDLEREGYACGAVVLPAACRNAPHRRHRIFWLADASFAKCGRRIESSGEHGGALNASNCRRTDDVANGAKPRLPGGGNAGADSGDASQGTRRCEPERSLPVGNMADMQRANARRGGEGGEGGERERGNGFADDGTFSPVAIANKPQSPITPAGQLPVDERHDGIDERMGNPALRGFAAHGIASREGGYPQQPIQTRDAVALGDGTSAGLEGYCGDGYDRDEPGRIDPLATRPIAAASPSGFWDDFVLLPSSDGKHRRASAERSVFPLAHGIPSKRKDARLGHLLARLGELGFDPRVARRIIAEAKGNRVGRLKGYGNAIVPEVAAQFVRACMELR